MLRGSRPGDAFIRVYRTDERDRPFRRLRSGILEVRPEATQPTGTFGRLFGRLKGILVGAPLSTARLAHERLSKVKALAVFSSDALSSSAYATEEILIVLAATGAANLRISVPIAVAIVALLTIVVISYRQTIRAYPNGGGAYIVAKDNLGQGSGLIAAAALLVDYILTVSVSVAAGVAAITSAVQGLAPFRVEIGIGVIALVTLLNLRGVSESATIFATPTYAFIITACALLVVGAIRVTTGSVGPVAHTEALAVTKGLGLFLILRAFASGCAALTGVEAISNGVPAFKPPESRNASITLIWMGLVLGVLFMGITLLANHLQIYPSDTETVVSQLGRVIFGHNPVYYFWQAATALILLLAANTSFADFPRLSSLLARDNYMPHQFSFRGDRLAFSNGIIVLGAASALILAVYGGDVTRLIPLYAVGVFVSFTFSQSGMVIHWRRHPEPGSRRSMVVNGFGAVATAVVAVIIIATKFTHGAWLSILIGFVLVMMFRAIHRHYRQVEEESRLPDLSEPLPLATRPQAMIVPVTDLNRAAVNALSYARSISPNVTAVHVTDDQENVGTLRERWEKWAGGIPLVIIESPYRAFTAPLLRYLDEVQRRDPEARITVVLAEYVPKHLWEHLLHNQTTLRLKAALLFRRNTVVIDVPHHIGR